MAYDRKEHLSLVKDRQHEQARALMPLVRLVAGAAPVMKAVTEDEHWNRYLSFLQGIMETWAKARDAAREKLASPAVWSHEALLKLKCDVLTSDATIEALQLAIDLPKAIMSGNDEAKRIIEEFERAQEKKNETT